jgi:hypothetical protein
MPNSLTPVMKDPVPSIAKGPTTNTTQVPTVVVDKPLGTTVDCYRPSKPTALTTLSPTTSKQSTDHVDSSHARHDRPAHHKISHNGMPPTVYDESVTNSRH